MTPDTIPLPFPHVIVQARHGWLVINSCDYYLGQSILNYGEYSEWELRILSLLYIRPGCIVEIGANMGLHSVPLARKAAEQGREFIAFEPQPAMFQLLCANLALNGLTSARAWPFACGQREETVHFQAPDYTAANSNFGGVSMMHEAGGGNQISVPCVTLDRMLHDKPVALLKIDVEGFEEEVLRGAQEIIMASRPVIHVENDREEKSESLIRCLFDLGYAAYWSETTLFNADNHAGREDDIFEGAVSANLVCVPAELNLEVTDAPQVIDPREFPVYPHPLDKSYRPPIRDRS